MASIELKNVFKAYGDLLWMDPGEPAAALGSRPGTCCCPHHAT